ncbi:MULTISPECIES: SixA phosphatase family protein [Microbacterium]|uniref:SixA phosphatase family protein n=1 Tax=Microbacterium TaxID=33882 RepID=UPI00217D9575|nr:MULTISPECIES: histidine phosphatase family protein [Microbacterium]UWF77359.1 histidine phosphatase family protein [Microbacterium neungamense]WCM55520.1 histidine phosphatase family protein [Microbacterium sp. EF45047]
MKTLLLARHAKSDWGMPGFADHDRPLNARGRRDAPAMAQRLVAEGVALDRIVSSSAVRARSTADEYAAAFGIPILEEPLLYGASARSILAIAATQPEDSVVAMLVGHNPGMSDAVGELTGEDTQLPTCAVAECAVDVGSWSELIEGSGRLLRVRTPADDVPTAPDGVG